VKHTDTSFIRRALEQADLGTLRMALYQATRDPEIAAMKPEAKTVRGGAGVSYQLPETYRQTLVEKGLEFLTGDGVSYEPHVPEDGDLRYLMEMAGDPLDDTQFLARREIPAFDPFPWAAQWTGARHPLPDDFLVAIVGAGFSGVGMGVQLQNLDIPYVIFERRPEVGGTWSINTYPGARVDTPSAVYEFSFEKSYPWTEHFAQQQEVRQYIEYIADKYGVTQNLRLSTEVQGATFDPETSRWQVNVAGPDGTRRTVTADFVISASGLFASPKQIDVEGIDQFSGDIVHTTAWSDSQSVADKNVAIIGNGSTGIQLLAQVAERAKTVSVFQRTPQWITPREQYGAPVIDEVRWLMKHVPYYWNWSRYTGALSTMDLYGLLTPDPAWQAAGGTFSRQNDAVREFLEGYIREQVGDRPDLVARLTPDYPPFARRMIVDNGWYRALLRDNVELMTDGIERLTRHGIVTADGRERPIDMIVTATGFSVEKYVWPADYVGRDGMHLQDRWAVDGVKAYLGMMIPGFPNFFIMYGPNSQNTSGGGAGLPTQIEIWTKYIASVIIAALEKGCATVEVEGEAYRKFNEDLDEKAAGTIWLLDKTTASKNYYVGNGRLLVNQPWPHIDWHEMITRPKLEDLNLGPVDMPVPGPPANSFIERTDRRHSAVLKNEQGRGAATSVRLRPM